MGKVFLLRGPIFGTPYLFPINVQVSLREEITEQIRINAYGISRFKVDNHMLSALQSLLDVCTFGPYLEIKGEIL